MLKENKKKIRITVGTVIIVIYVIGVIFNFKKLQPKYSRFCGELRIIKLKEELEKELGSDLTKEEIEKIEAMTEVSQAATIKAEIKIERKIEMQKKLIELIEALTN